ncbi:putative GTPase activating protein [Nitzschia inconspicua]|uniref:GTPase activating protein n=1 Tax=Nitzschia inconspicua TaxID=303405 RepID=A0A9K3M1I8_9STRA|nr:putative GTPase activating protein [Nitzschia inconspicua]
MGGTSADLKQRLRAIQNESGNLICVDCGDKKPTWASLLVPPCDAPQGSPTLGALCCYQCSGIHRSLGTHICFVRSITLDEWKENEILAMERGGNLRVNRIFEANLNNRSTKPAATSDMSVRNEFCKMKYMERKCYVANEYHDAIEAIRRAISSSSSHSISRNPKTVVPVKRLENSHQRKVAKGSSEIKAFSDADFFKSRNGDCGWEKPFDFPGNEHLKTAHRARKDNGELSRSWHPESPTKASRQRPSGVASSKTMDQRRNAAMNRKPKNGADLFSRRRQPSFHKEDDTILDSICRTDSVVTSSTATNTTMRSEGKRNDALAVSCHASLLTSNRSRNRDLSTSRHEISHSNKSNEAIHRLTRCDPPSNLLNEPRSIRAQSNSRAGRPRMQRTSSAAVLGRNDIEPVQSTKKASNLVVEALLDFIQATTDVTDEEINTILNSKREDVPPSRKSHRDNRGTIKPETRPEHGRSSADARRSNSRAGRSQRGESFVQRTNSGQRSRSSSRSASRSRAKSRSRRAVLSRGKSFVGSLEANNSKHSQSPMRSDEIGRVGEKKQHAQDNETHPSAIPVKERDANETFGCGRSRNRDAPARSVSGNSLSRSKRNNSKHDHTSQDPPARSRSRGSGRSKQSESGHGSSGRSANLSGRSRGGKIHGTNRTAPKRQLKSHHDTISFTRPSTEDDAKFRRTSSFSSCSDSTTVSEASDIMDEDDLLIM